MILGLVCLCACAAPGYQFNAGEFHQPPNDPCQRQEVRSAGAINWLNMKIGAPDGPTKRVVSIQSPSGSGYGGAVSCRAFLVFEDGTTQVGQLTVIDPGGAAPLSVTWRSDMQAAARRQVAPPLPVETEASDRAWGSDYATCPTPPTTSDDRAAVDLCRRRLEINRPFCVSYEGWAQIWFEMADDKAVRDAFASDPLKRTLSDMQTDVIEGLGNDKWEPPYYKLPDYKYQLRSILVRALERPSKWKDSAEFADYIYQSCLHDLAAQAAAR